MKQNQSLLFVIAEWWEVRKANSDPTIPNRRHVWHWFLPTPGNVIFTLLVIGSLLWAQNAGAISLGVPVVNSSLTIPYQGRLANASGAPFTGSQNMEFRLYNAPSGGTPLWTEFWTGGNAVNVSDGLFSVLLGSLQIGLPSVVQSNSQLWLGITVGTDGEMSPRVQLGSAAYSMQALTVPDGSISKAKLGSDISFVPPDGSVNNAKLVDGSVTGNKVADGEIKSADIADNSVASIDILDGNVTTSDISEGAVTKSKLGDNTLIRSPIAANIKIQYGKFLFGANCNTVAVSFQEAFSSDPIVIANQVEASGGYAYFIPHAITTTGFSVNKTAPSNCTNTGWVQWVAIGN